MSASPFSILGALQNDAAERLRDDSFFAGVPILTEQRGDLQHEIDLALGRLGLCVVVRTPEATQGAANVPGLYSDAVRLTVAVHEDVPLNRGATGGALTAAAVAEQVWLTLHLFRAEGIAEALVCEGLALEKDSELLQYVVTFRTSARRGAPAKAATPSITGTPGAVNVSGATEGSSIYVTTDGSYPRAGNSAAFLFSTPFTVSDSAMVRAAACLAGRQGSDVARKIITV